MNSPVVMRLLLAFLSAATSDLGLPRALREAVTQESDWTTRRSLVRLADSLEAGTPLPEALDELAGQFPPHVLALIRHGHETGSLVELLLIFHRMYQAITPLEDAIRLPVAMLGLLPAVLVTGTMVLAMTVSAAYGDLYHSMGLELPLVQRALLGLGDSLMALLAARGPLVAGAGLIAVLAGGWWLGVTLLARYPSAFPVIRHWYRIASEAAVAQTLALFLERGIPLDDALALCSRQSLSPELAVMLRRVREELVQGRPLEQALAASPEATASFRDALAMGISEGNPGLHLIGLNQRFREYISVQGQQQARHFSRLSHLLLGCGVGLVVFLFYLQHYGISLATTLQ